MLQQLLKLSFEDLRLIRTVDPTGLAAGNHFGADAETDELREDRSLHVHVPPHDSANRSIHNYTDAHDDEETNTHRLGSFVDQSGRNLTLVQTELFPSSSGNHFVHPSPTVKRTTSPTRSRPQGTHVEEGKSSRGRAYYVPEWLIYRKCRVDTPGWCRELMVGLGAQCHTLVKGEHEGCAEKLQVLEDQNIKLSRVIKYQTLWIRELEEVLARKDYALVYAERINAERAQEKEKLVAQLSETEMEKFDFGWAKWLTEERSKEDLLDLMSRMEGFDAYADKKMYVEYDKLFEKRYPFMERISNGFRHSVTDLLKVYPEPPLSGRAPSVTVEAPTKHSSGKKVWIIRSPEALMILFLSLLGSFLCLNCLLSRLCHGERNALRDSARWLIPLTLAYGVLTAFGCYALVHPFDLSLCGI
ncbi:hypothetical protein Tco_0697229 [Tanacetum coccineum]